MNYYVIYYQFYITYLDAQACQRLRRCIRRANFILMMTHLHNAKEGGIVVLDAACKNGACPWGDKTYARTAMSQ